MKFCLTISVPMLVVHVAGRVDNMGPPTLDQAAGMGLAQGLAAGMGLAQVLAAGMAVVRVRATTQVRPISLVAAVLA